MEKVWCPSCQRGNSYNDKGLCVDCGLEIAVPYRYLDIDRKEEQVMEASYDKRDEISVVAEQEEEKIDKEQIKKSLKGRWRKPMSDETKAKIKATRARNKGSA